MRATIERRFDLGLDAARLDARADADLVDHTLDAVQVADTGFRSVSDERPLDVAGERDPAVLDHELDRILRNRNIPVDGIRGRLGDLRVIALVRPGQDHVDVHRDALDAGDALRCAFGRPLLRVAVHVARQGSHPLRYLDANAAGVHRRLPIELVQDVFLKLTISFHGLFLGNFPHTLRESTHDTSMRSGKSPSMPAHCRNGPSPRVDTDQPCNTFRRAAREPG